MASPNYHFLYIDQTLDADWLFVAARRYWEHFRPMVIADLDLISYVPVVRTHMGWCKMVCVDREGIPAIAPLLGNNITPIIRVYRPTQGASVPAADMYFAWSEYYKAGARWFELYNEPNFDIEWPASSPPS